MRAKDKEREQAIKLRKQGRTYNEILKQVDVSKSTLSLWLRDVGLAKRQKQRLTARKKAAQKRGAAARREQRLIKEHEIYALCKKDISTITAHDLFLIGVVLYWAEGTKKNGGRGGSQVDFANSDPDMIKLFIEWLLQFGDITSDDIVLRLHLHQNHINRERDIIAHWSHLLSISEKQFAKTLIKKHNPKTVRKKIGLDYIGLVSVRVKRSTNLNRRIMGWIYAIIAAQK